MSVPPAAASSKKTDATPLWLRVLCFPFVVLRWLIRLLFGEIFWRPPQWAACLGRGADRATAYSRRRPRQAAGVALLLAAVVVAGIGGWLWWQAQPKPVAVTFTVKDPHRTRVESEDPVVHPAAILFSAPVAALENVDKDVTAGITVSPAIEGSWRWLGDNELLFHPKTDWPVGGDYTVTLSPRLFRPEARLAGNRAVFHPAPFAAHVVEARFDQDPRDPKNKRVVATIGFSHPVDTADFEKHVTLAVAGQKKGLLNLGEEKTAFSVSFDKKKLNAFIRSAELPIPKQPQQMQITVESGVRAQAGGKPQEKELTMLVDIPAVDSLRVDGIRTMVVTNEKFLPEQVLNLRLSMLVHESEAKNAIKAWLLPEQPPEGFLPPGTEIDPKKPFDWNVFDILRIDDKLLKSTEALKIEPIPAENELSDNFSYRYKAASGRYLYIEVSPRLKAFGGYELGGQMYSIHKVPHYPAMVKIMAEGSLLSLSGERKLSILARDVPAVRYEIGRVLPQQLQQLVGKGFNYNEDFSRPRFYSNSGEAEIIERFESTTELSATEPGKPQYGALDLSGYLDAGGQKRRGVFLLHVQGYDPKTKELLGGEDHRLVIVSDLALIDKQMVDGSHALFVQSIYSGGPVGDAVIELIGRNGLPVMQVRTDASGHAEMPNLDDFKYEKEPKLFVVSKNGDTSFLPYNLYDRFNRNLNYSRFDVGGAVNAVEANQLSAYLFSDRGIYRPGEEIRVGLIVRATDWAKPVEGLPMEIEVIDARGLTVRRDKITLPAAGFGELRHATLDTAPTGTYTINLHLIKKGRADTLIGSTAVRVQDFEPDRLKIRVDFNRKAPDGWVSPDDLKARVSLQNLFATPAENRRVRGYLSLSPGVLSFPKYKDFLFDDPQRAKEPVSETLAETTTDVQGEAALNLDLQRFARATYRAHVVVQGFEADGGRGVSGEASVLVSGLDYLVGYKADGKFDFVRRDSVRHADLIAIDPDGNMRAVQGLTLQLLERRFVSVLTRQDDGTYRYQSKEKEILLEEKPLTIAATGEKLTLLTGTPGGFVYVVRDREGLEYARIQYNVAGEANLTRSLDKNAELKLTLAKSDFSPGEDIEVQIEAPYTGSGLITIERDRVYTYRWFRTTTTSTVQKIKLPENVDGNAYLTVTFVRDIGSDEIYMSPLSYGVAPFSVSRERYKLALDVKTPERIKPGETLRFEVKGTEAARVAVFAVDEGILQVARYKTADPLGYFFQKRALEVSTSQLLDLILPEFSRIMASAPGGDAEGALGRFLNPFKRKRDPAVAYWSGIIDLGKAGRTLEWTVPESFNGSLRVMAVAVNDRGIGVFDGKTTVRGDFVISPNAPLTVTPGDEFDVPVGVSNNLEGSGEVARVAVTLDAGEHFEVIGEARIEAAIAEGREGVVHFRLRAKPLPGSATLKLVAGIGNKQARLTTAVGLRPATQYRQEINIGMLPAGKEIEVPVTRNLFADLRTLRVGMSATPLVAADGLTSYLEHFPYTCTEQIVSQAVPALVLSHRPEFGTLKSGHDADLKGLIAMLRGRQNAEGAYGAWAANAIFSYPTSIWAQQFLVEAKDRGEAVPADMLTRGNEWLHGFAATEGKTLGDDRMRAQAVYVLTRQGMQTSGLASAIQKRLETRDTKVWKNDLAAMYLAATYQLLKQERLATQTLADFRFGESDAQKERRQGIRGDPLNQYQFDDEWLYDETVRDAAALYLLARHFPEHARALPESAYASMLETLRSYRYTTYTSGQLLLALDALASLSEAAGDRGFAASEVLRDGKKRALALSPGLVTRAPFTPEAGKIALRNGGSLMSFYAVEASGFDVVPPDAELREGIEVLREYTDAKGKPVTTVTQGDEVYVHLKFRALQRSYPNVAVVDLLPGGFDLVQGPATRQPNSNESQTALRRDETSSEDDGGEGYESEEMPPWAVPFGNSPTNWSADYADMHEDRVVLYGTLDTRVHEFVYKIRATNLGTFTLPPAYAEGLYNRTVRARSLPGGKLAVVPPAK